MIGHLVIFTIGAGVVWFAGTWLARLADAIAERTNVGKVFIGVVLLATATSLPEIATTATAATLGNAPLALSNLFGGIVVQTAMLVVADVVAGRAALTFFVAKPALMLQGLSLIALLAVALAAMATGDFYSILGIGMWSPIIFAIYVLALLLIRHHDADGAAWRPVDIPNVDDYHDHAVSGDGSPPLADWSLRRIMVLFAGASAAVLAAGYQLTRSADALAVETGLGASFVGAVFLAIATSLPELSATISAVRIGSYAMAVANIFGSNALMVALLIEADLFYREGSLLAHATAPVAFSAAMGVTVTVAYLIGIVERRNRTVFHIGLDSLAALVVLASTLAGLFLMR